MILHWLCQLPILIGHFKKFPVPGSALPIALIEMIKDIGIPLCPLILIPIVGFHLIEFPPIQLLLGLEFVLDCLTLKGAWGGALDVPVLQGAEVSFHSCNRKRRRLLTLQ